MQTHTLGLGSHRDRGQAGQCTLLSSQPDLPQHNTHSRRPDTASATEIIRRDSCTQQGPPGTLPFLFTPSTAYSFSYLNKKWELFFSLSYITISQQAMPIGN